MRISIRLLALPLLVFGLFLTGCDSDGGDDDSDQSVEGTWERTEPEPLVPDSSFTPELFEVTPSALTTYSLSDEGDCFGPVREYTLVENEGDRYSYERTTSSGNSFVTNIVFDLNGNSLEVTDDSNGDINDDPVSYERADPAIVDGCTSNR